MKKFLTLMLAALLCLSMLGANAEVTKIATLDANVMTIGKTDRVRINVDEAYALAATMSATSRMASWATPTSTAT